MTRASLVQRNLATCRNREFNTIDELADEIPQASWAVVRETTIHAIRRGCLRGYIRRTELMDGPVAEVGQIRG